MRPELPQGFDSRQVFDLLCEVAREHWALMPQYGLPQTPRAIALRTFGQFLVRKLNGGKLVGDETKPPCAPFANTLGRLKLYEQTKPRPAAPTAQTMYGTRYGLGNLGNTTAGK
jgi:hypothetical protein